jgi:septal ring factor EnvC (AmiA/AmiB activator)
MDNSESIKYEEDRWLSYFDSLGHKFRAAIQDIDYVKSRDKFLREIERHYSKKTNSIKKLENVIRKYESDIQYLRLETEGVRQELEEHYENHTKEYYTIIITDYQKWLIQTGKN